MIDRIIEQDIKNDIDSGKIIVLIGARQVGKTTLFDQISQSFDNVLRLNCDNYDDRLDLEGKTSAELKQLIGGYRFVIIDEAQRVKNIGLTLKMIADLKLGNQVLVTGSSSLDLSNEINEAATGRLWEYNLFPLCTKELVRHTSAREESKLLEQRLLYGLYPEVVTHSSDARRILTNLANNYLYKDLLEYRGIKKPDLIQKLVRALALQIGSEVSYNELSSILGVNKETVENYIDLLEKCYVIFRLTSYSRNLRSEIKKGKKIYFYDNGIRNALINNFAPLELRNDVGALWENFLISERYKRNIYSRNYTEMYFWRSTTQQEVDLVEVTDGRMEAYEMKWRKPKAKLPSTFAQAYLNTPLKIVNQENYIAFLD